MKKYWAERRKAKAKIAKPRRDGHEEIAREHGAGMIADERAPLVGRDTIARCLIPSHVAPYRTRRHSEAQLQPQFRGNPLLAPRHIRTSHGGNQLLDVRR